MRDWLLLFHRNKKTFPHHVRTTAGAFCSGHELGLTPVTCAVTPQRLADVLSNKTHTNRQAETSYHIRYDVYYFAYDHALFLHSFLFPDRQHLLLAETTITLLDKPLITGK